MAAVDVRSFIGKPVELRKVSGALYRGTFWRTGINRYALVHVTFISKHGTETTPGSSETRRIKLEDISTIKFLA